MQRQEGQFSAFQWLLAWMVLLVVLAVVNRNRFGHTVLYYGLVLMLIFLIATQFAWFNGVLAPFRSLGPGLVPRAGTAAGPSN